MSIEDALPRPTELLRVTAITVCGSTKYKRAPALPSPLTLSHSLLSHTSGTHGRMRETERKRKNGFLDNFIYIVNNNIVFFVFKRKRLHSLCFEVYCFHNAADTYCAAKLGQVKCYRCLRSIAYCTLLSRLPLVTLCVTWWVRRYEIITDS